MPDQKNIAIIGYSGHAYVAIDIFLSTGKKVVAYCDLEKKLVNPFELSYLGTEDTAAETLKQYGYFISIGDNHIRRKIQEKMTAQLGAPLNAVHASAVIAASAVMGTGVFVAANASINPLVNIGNGVICNTSSVIDHECIIGDFAHIGPGAVVCGNVKIGAESFVGAAAVIRQGITIGKNVMIGAGAVIVKNVPDNTVMIGNPQQELKK